MPVSLDALPGPQRAAVLLVLLGEETAAKLVATESAPGGALPTKERLRELLAYSVSEEYFRLRLYHLHTQRYSLTG